MRPESQSESRHNIISILVMVNQSMLFPNYESDQVYDLA